MCSIVGSFDKEKIIELCRLNEYRGQYSHSISYYDVNNRFINVNRYLGSIDYNNINIPDSNYCIIHMQAPTGVLNNNNIHPAQIEDNYLWHNGIIKPNGIDIKYKSDWDTLEVLKKIIDTKSADNIDGSFSCLFYNKDLILFRNEISPMFIDKNLNISSTKFNNSVSTIPNVMLTIDFKAKTTNASNKFNTVENPYYFGE